MWDARTVDETEHLGMSGEAARAKAEASGWAVRLYGADDALKSDFRPNRLNLQVDQTGTVVSAKVF